MNTLKIALAQLTFRVGDVEGNATKVITAAARARDELHADLVLFPELTLTGYPPDDLLLRPDFIAAVDTEIERIRAEVRGITVCFGAPVQQGEQCFNAALVISNGQELGRYFKQCLPNYGVFDEKRYFTPGTASLVFDLKGYRLGVTICEDLWFAAPALQAHAAGAEILLQLSASPYHRGKRSEREAMIRQRIAATGLPVVTVNLLGGQDDLIFDGEATVYSHTQALTMRLPCFTEILALGTFKRKHGVSAPVLTQESIAEVLPVEEELYAATVQATRDYVLNSGFSGAVIGLSGGIDSALVLAIAVDALGKDQVEAVMMPGLYTATISLEDAAAQAERMGVRYTVLPIEAPMRAFESVLEPRFEGLAPDTTEENIQARCRAILLMAISNKTGRLVLTTGNKSEVAVGYATLYGDMAGGFAPLKDVPKMWVYRLAAYRNTLGRVIPERVLTRAPSAELRPDQKDEDSLPPYPILDAILEQYVEHDASVSDLIAAGFDEQQVRDVVRRVDQNEYKRRQSAPGVKLTSRAFGRERRYPLTSVRKHS